MNSEAREQSSGRALRAPNGFTLVEVLVAMVILAIGLLGLEALGIAAAKSTAQAQHRTQLAAAATQALEARMQTIRNSTAPINPAASQCQDDAARMIRTCVEVQIAGLPAGAARVVVQTSRTAGVPTTYSLSSYVFR